MYVRSMFALEMKQLGGTEVNSNTWGMRDGVWPNLFTATIKIINGSVDIVSICDVLGEYQNTGIRYYLSILVPAHSIDNVFYLEHIQFWVHGWGSSLSVENPFKNVNRGVLAKKNYF